MAITIRTLTQALTGKWQSNIDALDQPVGEIVQLAHLRVLGSETHTTLVACTAEEIDDVLTGVWSVNAHLLPDCVLLSSDLDDEVLRRLDDEGLRYLVGPTSVERSVFETIEGVITQHLAYEDRMVSSTMRALTLIARTGGIQGVLSELSRSVDGWAVLLDSHGQVIESVGAARLHIEDAISVVLNRAVRIRYPDLQVHTVGGSTGEEHAARLVLASRAQSAYRIRAVAAHAAALLALLMRTTTLTQSERNARELVLETLITRGHEAPELLHKWKITDPVLGGFKVLSKTRNIDVERLVSLWFDRAEASPLYVADASEAYGFAPVSALQAFAQYANEFRTGQGQRVSLGLGSGVSVNTLALTLQQAEQALDAAIRTQQTVLWFDELLTIRDKHLELTDEQLVTVQQILEPITLSEHGSGELIETLYVFLAHHGSWTSAARELKVHRQTLINRVQRIEETLDLSLSNPDHRALLWLAIRNLARGGSAA